MKRLLLFFILIPIVSQAQEDSLGVFRNQPWTTDIHSIWFQSDTVTLVPAQNEGHLYSERITINETNELEYRYYISCPVGESWPVIEHIKLINGTLSLRYRVYAWETINSDQDPFETRVYDVLEWNKRTIILKRKQN